MNTLNLKLNTVMNAIAYTKRRFREATLYYGHGTDNSNDEAIALVLYVAGLSHDTASLQLKKLLTNKQKKQLLNYIERRIHERVPLAYLTTQAWFAGFSFYVNPHVLIPRSPLAEWIEARFSPWIEEKNIENILDLCTGSGCIAIACAKYFKKAKIDASDLCEQALAIAQKNVRAHRVQKQVTLYQSDLFASLPKKQYDVIVSNPPYVNSEELSTLPEEYLYEPALGLHGGTDGLVFILAILKHAAQYLSPHGILIVEVGNSEHALVERFKQIDFMWLHCQRGGDGIFLLTAEQLHRYQGYFDEKAKHHHEV